MRCVIRNGSLYVHYHLVVIRWHYILQSKDVKLFGRKYKASIQLFSLPATSLFEQLGKSTTIFLFLASSAANKIPYQVILLH